ncbi:hypothetical protein ACFLTS_00080 [Chloroflexota bacterium]
MEQENTRQERREKRRIRARRKMLQHGRSLVRVYKDAVLKRIKRVRRGKG